MINKLIRLLGGKTIEDLAEAIDMYSKLRDVMTDQQIDILQSINRKNKETITFLNHTIREQQKEINKLKPKRKAGRPKGSKNKKK